jgi:SAM-dependent methyltransferase
MKWLLNFFPRPLLIRLSQWGRPLLDLWFRGNQFTDPINKKSYRKFLPYGYVRQRNNALSPGTLSLERHRLLWLYLERETDFFKSRLKVLHVAPEQSFYKIFKKLNNLDYTTVDLYSPLADIKADICDLPFKENQFDVILCNHVLEHIPDDKKAMEELYRVLKPGGWAILQVPLDALRLKTFQDDTITEPKERMRVFGQYDHVRLYGMDYFEKLQKSGFSTQAINYGKELTREEIARFGVVSHEIIPRCFKH